MVKDRAAKARRGSGVAKAGEPKKDAFVGKVVRDPAAGPNVQLFIGFVGDSPHDGHVRIYGNTALSTFVDVPSDAVVHSEPQPPERSPLGGSYVWVAADAPVKLPDAAPAAPKAGDFLKGAIHARYLEGRPGRGITPEYSHTDDCSTNTCPTPSISCPSKWCPSDICKTSDFCPTKSLGCNSNWGMC
jgi:hypothetical protein